MKSNHLLGILLTAFIANTIVGRAWSDAFGSGANAFTIDFVTIGNPGIAADNTTGSLNPAGSVPYTYRMRAAAGRGSEVGGE